ncbi:MAG: tyrosine-type recombinase/integrase [Lachnospiraceae bacterium]|nr:tyrosine-type recombinase/integrase [Lachnospiraceae bacterium]
MRATRCICNDETIYHLEQRMREEEKSKATMEKYCHDVRAFLHYIGEEKVLSKELVITYKNYLGERYEVSSANSMLAALNYFLRFIGREDCIVKSFRIQKEAFRSREQELTREEYLKLLEEARKRGDERLYMIMQTICATGIRISELPFITVASLQSRRARVLLKGKTRTVLLPLELCNKLKNYAAKQGIEAGSVFVTRSGRPVERSNIFHAMKKLCQNAEVAETKVYPHNLRHLFAVTFYKEERDICHLADLLGHSNINTTRIYTLISCEEQERQLDSLCLCQ